MVYGCVTYTSNGGEDKSLKEAVALLQKSILEMKTLTNILDTKVSNELLA